MGRQGEARMPNQPTLHHRRRGYLSLSLTVAVSVCRCLCLSAPTPDPVPQGTHTPTCNLRPISCSNYLQVCRGTLLLRRDVDRQGVQWEVVQEGDKKVRVRVSRTA